VIYITIIIKLRLMIVTLPFLNRILKLHITGNVVKAKESWRTNELPKAPDSTLGTRPVALEQTLTLFGALMFSCAIAAVILMIEKIYNRFKRSKLTGFKCYKTPISK